MKGKKTTAFERKKRFAEDPNERRRVFKALIDHLKDGMSLSSFGPLSESDIKLYLEKYPEEFFADEIEEAKRWGRDYWEKLGQKQAAGTCLGNSRTWYYNMANRYGWREKIDIEAEHKGSINVNVVNYATQRASKDKCEQ